jgi:hypothetical protein
MNIKAECNSLGFLFVLILLAGLVEIMIFAQDDGSEFSIGVQKLILGTGFVHDLCRIGT